MDRKRMANENFLTQLSQNEYPGRGIVMGLDESGTKFVQIYWIMGRSQNSQNRLLIREADKIKTAPVDATNITRPELIIYNAIRRSGHNHIVSNGDHTDTIYEVLQNAGTLELALATRSHEPDAPNYTPRISGLLQFDQSNSVVWLAIIKKSLLDDFHSIHHFYRYDHFSNGFGMCIHTYQHNGDPLPSFEGEPYMVPLQSSTREIAETYYHALNPDYRISLVVKTIEVLTEKLDYYIINKHDRR